MENVTIIKCENISASAYKKLADSDGSVLIQDISESEKSIFERCD